MTKRSDKTTGNYATEEQLVGAILAMNSKGMRQPAIAEACGVSIATVSRRQNPPKERRTPINLNDLWIIRDPEINCTED